MRSILFLIVEGLIAIFSIILLPIFKRNEKFMFKYVHFFAKAGNFTSGNKIEVIGEENLTDEAALFVANHESYFDLFNIVSVTKTTPIGFLAKQELKKIPIISLWMAYAKSEFLDRDNLKKQVKSISNASKTLKSGHNIGVFPEGTRSTEDLEFKPGSFKVAQKAQKPIQPLTLVNTSAVFERQGRIKSSKTYVIIHKPIAYEEYKDKKLVDVAKEVETLIRTTRKEYSNKINA